MRHCLHQNIEAAIMPAMQWKNIISDLKASGLTQMQIAERCGCAQSTISEMSTDGDRTPSFPIGAALLDLHKKTLKKRKTVQVAA
jgi:predicted transcriptional regulator